MASSNLVTLEEAEKATNYFSRLAEEAYGKTEHQAMVYSKDMVRIASIAASSLSYRDRLKDITEKLNKNRFYVPKNVKTSLAQNFVHQMTINYIEGQRNFGEQTLKGARDVCRTMDRYLFLLDVKRSGP